MLRNIALLLFIASIALAATDTWPKVRDLPGGTELRVYKKDGKPPMTVKFADATEDKLMVVVKNEEVSIPKDQIERIDYRPPQKGSRMAKTETTTVDDPNTKAPIGPARDARVPGQSSSSNVSWGGSKPDFETIYRRPPVMPEKK